MSVTMWLLQRSGDDGKDTLRKTASSSSCEKRLILLMFKRKNGHILHCCKSHQWYNDVARRYFNSHFTVEDRFTVPAQSLGWHFEVNLWCWCGPGLKWVWHCSCCRSRTWQRHNLGNSWHSGGALTPIPGLSPPLKTERWQSHCVPHIPNSQMGWRQNGDAPNRKCHGRLPLKFLKIKSFSLLKPAALVEKIDYVSSGIKSLILKTLEFSPAVVLTD